METSLDLIKALIVIVVCGVIGCVAFSIFGLPWWSFLIVAGSLGAWRYNTLRKQ